MRSLRGDDYHYIPIKRAGVTTYIFPAELAQDAAGRWSAWLEALPGCAVWSYTKQEALEALTDAAQAHMAVLAEKGQRLPAAKAIGTIEAPVVAVTL